MTSPQLIADDIASHGRLLLELSLLPLAMLVGGAVFWLRLLRKGRGQAAPAPVPAAMQELIESERRFRLLADTIPQLAWITDARGQIEFFNRRWTDYTGLSLAESLGPAGKELIHPAEAQQLEHAWTKALSTGTPFEVRYRLRGKAGDYRWQLARAQPCRNDHGTLISWFGTCTDIDEQIKAQESAGNLTQRLQAVVNSLDVIIWAVDPQGTFQFYEGKGLAIAKVTAAQRIGHNIKDLFPDDHPIHAAVARGLEGQSTLSDVMIGGVRFEVTCSPVRDANGAITGVAGVSNNVSDRLHMEQSLNESRARLESVIASAPMILWAMDEHGIMTLNEGSALTRLGRPKGYGVGKSIFEVANYQPAATALIKRAQAGEEIIETTQFGGRTFETLLSPVRDGQGVVRGVNGVSHDITERRFSEEAKRELEIRERAALQSAKTKSEFLANMSHEIRTPLNGVLGMIDLLLGTPLAADQREYADSVRFSADALLTVINDILDFSKIEAGRLDFEEKPVNLSHIARDIETCFSVLAAKKSLKLTVTNQLAQRCLYLGDQGRIWQVINNLMSNAIKFTDAGHVQLSIAHQNVTTEAGQPDTLRIEVSDSGIGIPDETLLRLFTPFTQADASTARRFGGTGLGLSICKHLVEAMGGEIGAASQPDVGSKFWFTVRLKGIAAPAPAPTAAPAASASISPANLGKRVLLAEDNPINQRLALAILEKLGLRGFAVGNGKEAVEALRQSDYDLVLMDCQMPEMDGYEATRQIRQLPPERHPDIPIVALTANAFKEDRDRCLAVGMNDYVSKPVRTAILADALDRWLSHGSGVKAA